MTLTSANAESLSKLDRPNSYIGRSVPRPNLDRLMQGRGLYVSDMELPRMANAVFLRSPHAHARILARVRITHSGGYFSASYCFASNTFDRLFTAASRVASGLSS